MKTKIQALVLSVVEYKEKDGLVKVLTADSILTLYARGPFKPNSKNLRLVQPFSYNEFMIEDKMKMPLLLQGHTIHYYYHIQEDLLKSSCCFVLHDLIQRTRKEENLFNVLLDCWNSADKNLDDFYFWACIVLKYCIEQEEFNLSWMAVYIVVVQELKHFHKRMVDSYAKNVIMVNIQNGVLNN